MLSRVSYYRELEVPVWYSVASLASRRPSAGEIYRITSVLAWCSPSYPALSVGRIFR